MNEMATEFQFIDINLAEIQDFLSIGNIIPIGLHSSRIISDILCCIGISHVVITDIIDYFKIIDINDIYIKYQLQMNHRI